MTHTTPPEILSLRDAVARLAPSDRTAAALDYLDRWALTSRCAPDELARRVRHATYVARYAARLDDEALRTVHATASQADALAMRYDEEARHD